MYALLIFIAMRMYIHLFLRRYLCDILVAYIIILNIFTSLVLVTQAQLVLLFNFRQSKECRKHWTVVPHDAGSLFPLHGGRSLWQISSSVGVFLYVEWKAGSLVRTHSVILIDITSSIKNVKYLKLKKTCIATRNIYR